MRCIIPQITWHSREPVLSVDFDPSCKSEDGFYRLASGGADKQILIWHVREPDTLKPSLLCMAELKRHQKAINIVRFSPDGSYIASADDDAFIVIWKNDLKTENEENWVVEKSLRRHLEDVSDLCWSADGTILISGSVDNSAVVWDVKKGSTIHTLSDHGGYVNGVTYDPLSEYIVTMCTDRSLRFYNFKTGKLTHKMTKFPPSWLSETASKTSEEAVAEGSLSGDKEKENINEDNADTVVKKPHVMAPLNRMFCDADDTFCRRMSFSPKGELLVVPGGILPPVATKENVSKFNSVQTNAGDNTPLSSPGDPEKNKGKGKNKKKCLDKPAASNNGVIIFCRNSMTTPCAIIPTGKSFSTSVRFSSVYYERHRARFAYDTAFVNSMVKGERTIACVGRLRPPSKSKKPIMNTPYRLVFAVATNDSILIGDTSSPEPLAQVKNIHCTRITDVSWSANGRFLVASSTDGYCSLITFSQDELGLEYPLEQVSMRPDCFPVPAPEIIKPKKKEPVKKERKPKLVTVSTVAPKEPKPTEEKTPVAGVDTVSEPSPLAQPAKTPTSAKVVQKNTLLKWVIKKPKQDDEGMIVDDLPQKIEPKREPELICLDDDSLEILPSENKGPSATELTIKSPAVHFFKNATKKPDISQLEILKLQTAPIKNESLLQASIAENAHYNMPRPMEVDEAGSNCQVKSVSRPSTKGLTTKSEKSLSITPVPRKANSESPKSSKADKDSTSSTMNSSPVSSTPSKQPRRIQLITLTECPKINKGNLD